MSGEFLRTSSTCRSKIDAGWALCSTPAGEVASPQQLEAGPVEWIALDSIGTAAHALRAMKRWSLDAPARRFDADDWWFRTHFDAPRAAPDARQGLVFDGLAGHAEVWLNGEPLLASDNMHVSHTVAEPRLRGTGNELLMRFASLDQWLAKRRPRPRWRAPMVDHQQMRWTRTTLLGRTPGWSPPAAAVGPWRDVWLVETRGFEASQLKMTCRLEDGHGVVRASLSIDPIAAGSVVESVVLEVERAGRRHQSTLTRTALGANAFSGELAVAAPDLWWPHTHGEPVLYAARLVVSLSNDDEAHAVPLNAIGFRTLSLDTQAGDFSLEVNGVPVFCRGACWTPLDVVSLRSSPAACRAALEQVRDAGMNMLRVSGAMVYEEDHFHDACDALGILVWQDFMFANMDYPADDAAFSASVTHEVSQQLSRWQCRPSLAVLCGNSEVEQQAAMWGAGREVWQQPLFRRDIAELAARWCPQVPYWPSSAHGGAFPHQNNAGTTSYYGVGAYLRPLEDARRSGTRFATECLAFANVPPDSTLARMPGGSSLRVHHANWKLRSPRDMGAGWDFDDVRDHYLQRLYGLDPVALRSSDPTRYLQFSRAVSGEVMGAAFAEWRRGGSGCRGAIVWFLRDLWAGAGWGLLDDHGVPKAAFHGVRRALAPVALFITDEGTNGLDLHVVNESGRTLDAMIDIDVYRDDGLRMEHSAQAHVVSARSTLSLAVAGCFDTLLDLSRAYRFGPAEHSLVVATLRDSTGALLAQAFHFPEGLPSRCEREVDLSAHAHRHDDGSAELTVKTTRFAQSVHFELPDFIAQDEYFHLAPGSERTVRLTPSRAGTRPPIAGRVAALNSRTTAPVLESQP